MKKNNNKSIFLGIDAGSTALSIVAIDSEKNIVDTMYSFHHGKIHEAIANYCAQFGKTDVCGIGFTSSATAITGGHEVNSIVAYVTAIKHTIPQIRTCVIVGGEKFGVIEFDDNGNYSQYRGNTSCAAGTGGFLDQQARRLQLDGSHELSAMALKNYGDIPKIASRCAVFAKTDLIHVQQEGYDITEICDGLCYGVARNIADTLFASHTPAHPVAIVGGVSLNSAVVKHLESIVDVRFHLPELSHIYGAFGAALYVANNTLQNAVEFTFNTTLKNKLYHFPPLAITMSNYPTFNGIESFVHTSLHDVEVDIYKPMNGFVETFIGIDIGSTSTKMALIDKQGTMLAGFYTRTAGKPLEAVQSIFEACDVYAAKHGISIFFKGAATTGSGRKFIGTLIGADCILDEITAHAKAACTLQPDVDTIIEIGGQDSKFTMIKNGNVIFSQMNNVCAAGTGSFIEEQAYKLGCNLVEYATRALNKQSPLSSDRCTVFMERDINYCMSQGYDTDELLAAVLHSVVENYLSKVSG